MGYSQIRRAKIHAISGHQGTHAPPVPTPPLPPSLLCHQPEIVSLHASKAEHMNSAHRTIVTKTGGERKATKKLKPHLGQLQTPIISSPSLCVPCLATTPPLPPPPPSPPPQSLPYNSQPPFANSIFHKWSTWHCQSHYYPPQRVFELNIRRVAITPLFALFSLFVAVVGILLVQLMAKTSSGACDDKRHRFTGYSFSCSERTIDTELLHPKIVGANIFQSSIFAILFVVQPISIGHGVIHRDIKLTAHKKSPQARKDPRKKRVSDACYDRGITSRLKWFLNDGAP